MWTNNRLSYVLGGGADIQDIRGKAVVIVGDAATAGRTAAAMLAEQGAPVFLAAQDVAELKGTLAAIAQSGGEGDGMVVDLKCPEDVQRFFDQAQFWMGGRVDAVVSFIHSQNGLAPGVDPEIYQNLIMQESIQRIQADCFGQIICVSPAQLARRQRYTSPMRSITAALRHQASELGIRVTLVEYEEEILNQFDEEGQPIGEQQLARCIFSSLAQPFSADLVLLRKEVLEQQQAQVI